jgi:hypothetical protein
MKLWMLLIPITLFAKTKPEKLGRPLMYEKTVETMFSKQEAHICHSSDDLNDKDKTKEPLSKVNTDYFNARIACEYKCKGEKNKYTEVKDTFRPLELSLFEGDGSSKEKILWRSLGITLTTWAEDNCYLMAKANCSDDQIKKIKVNKITSGNWSWDAELNCSQKKIIYSPFDEQFKLDNLGFTTYKPFETSITPSFNFTLGNPQRADNNSMAEFFRTKSRSEIMSYFESKECKKPIKVHTCFGDCIWETDQKNKLWTETLATTEYLGEDKFTICGDDLETNLQDRKASKAVRELKCKKYIWEYMRKTEMMGGSCAAIRFESNCHKF